MHGARLFDCVDDADCVSGTACLDAEDLPDRVGWPRANDPPPGALSECYGKPPRDADGGIEGKVCAVPGSRTGARQALTHGFHVGAFDLKQLPDGDNGEPGAFGFTPPPEASVVHCALFACRPAVRHTRTDKEGREYSEIVNYDQCVLSQEILGPGSGVFDVRNQDLEYHAPAKPVLHTAVPSPGECLAVQSRRIAELAVGCWAFDSTNVIGATPLLPIDGRQIYNYLGVFADCTGDDSGGKACFVDSTSRTGACSGGVCRDLCVDNRDCPTPKSSGTAADTISDGKDAGVDAATDAAPTPAPSNGRPTPTPPRPMLCEKMNDTSPPAIGTTRNYVGVCIPL